MSNYTCSDARKPRLRGVAKTNTLQGSFYLNMHENEVVAKDIDTLFGCLVLATAASGGVELNYFLVKTLYTIFAAEGTGY